MASLRSLCNRHWHQECNQCLTLRMGGYKKYVHIIWCCNKWQHLCDCMCGYGVWRSDKSIPARAGHFDHTHNPTALVIAVTKSINLTLQALGTASMCSGWVFWHVTYDCRSMTSRRWLIHSVLVTTPDPMLLVLHRLLQTTTETYIGHLESKTTSWIQ